MAERLASTLAPVSSDTDELILVTSNDHELGYLNKSACHDGEGILHRAFSLFLFDSAGSVLLQQRAAGKRLWPGYWSNACCSHPRRGESMPEAVKRRAGEELGIQPRDLTFVFKFEYQARYGHVGSEHELCSVFIGRSDERPCPHPDEIDDWKWQTPIALDQSIALQPEAFTPWFISEWGRLRSDYSRQMAHYIG